MGFVYAAQHVVENQDRGSRFVELGIGQEDAQAKGVHVRITEVGSRRRYRAVEGGVDRQRSAFLGVELQADLAQSFLGMDTFIEPADFVGDIGQQLVGIALPLLDHDVERAL